MDFDDHDDPDEEMGLPPGPKLAGSELQLQPGSSHRKGTGSGGRYRECLKNHAVGIGGHAVDGCGEFMAAGEEGTLDALRCAACNCHRNFHRKESPEGGGGSGSGPSPASAGEFHHQFSPYYRTPAGYLHHHHGLPFMRPPAPLALPSTSGGGGGGHSRGGGGGEEEELSDPAGVGGGGVGGGSSSSGRKRFRTKFTQEQKDKMLAFAERVGWRIQKHDEAAVQQFCNETGVKRHVLKVWMHNNKHTLGKKP